MDPTPFLELGQEPDSSISLHRIILFVPPLCATASAALLLPRIAPHARQNYTFANSHPESGREEDSRACPPSTDSRSHLTRSHQLEHVRNSIFRWDVSRLLSCIVLIALTVIAAVSEYTQHRAIESSRPHWVTRSNSNWIVHSFISNYSELTLCLFFTYVAFLSVLTLSLTSLRASVDRHLSLLLLIAFVALTWHELLLLSTYRVHPTNPAGGWLTWARVGFISFSALVPIFTPRLYDFQEVQESDKLNPEETASVISLVLYNFINPLIWMAYRSGKLNYEQLPSLARYDRADVLRRRSFTKLDPLNQPERHLFWGIVDVFWKEYCVMAGMIIVKVLAELAGPVGIRYILKYLEDPSEPGYFRPWVWILLLFLGPAIGAIAMQWYVFTTTGMVVRIEAMVSQLLFEHSLRIRMTGEHSDMEREFPQATSREGRHSSPSTRKPNRSSSLVGRIHNLMSTDVNNVSQDFLFVLFFAPLRVIFNVLFLYWILGWSAIIGLFFMVALLFVPGKAMSLINKVQIEWAKRTDIRVQLIVESLNIVRTIKLFAWEKRVKAQSEEKRREELNWYRKRQLLGILTMNINYALPLVVMITELLDSYKNRRTEVAASTDSVVGVCNASFTWSSNHASSSTHFRLRIDGKLLFRQGHINMVIGPTGCGKTSLLMALLGEMHYMPNGPESWVSLPRERGIGYAAQEAWIQDVTIKENILFGTEYNEERYNKVVFQCCLEPDLKLLESGDQTKVGERGVTLRLEYEKDMNSRADHYHRAQWRSEGKYCVEYARVSLARSIYSKAEFILLDDVLSALDVHTSRWIVDKCFRGDLVGGRTLIIVTHNVVMVSEIAEFVVALGHEGRILSQGSVEDVLGAETKLGDRANTERDPENSSGEVADGTTGVVSEQPNVGGKSTTVEETPEVGWSALKLFFFAMGGVGFWFIYLAGFVLANIVALIQTYWLGIWARAYDTPSRAHQVNVSFYLGVYSSIGLCGMVLYSVAFIVHISGSIRAARRIHDRLVSSVFAAPLYWLDATPIGRIISRFTQDVRSIDGSLPNQLQNLTDMTIQIISRFIAIMIVSPAFSLAGALLLALGVWLGRVYISAQISVKRHMSNARSPMYSYFHAALAGTTTIRAYGAEAMVRREVQARVDVHTRAARTFWSLNRWIAIRMDVLGGLFSAGLAAWLVYVRTGVDASVAGFALNTAVALSGGTLWWIRTANEFQVQTNSLERIHSYLVIPHEPSSDRPAPPAHWPSSGSLIVENLGAGYTPNGAQVLHDVSFEIKHGERVAIVGRTGSGKSSLVLALLRMIHTTGTVHYDGVETTSIPLDALRSSITVVPQQPELSSGTIRENLDPFGERPDAVLWDALQAVGFDSIGLDESVAPGGSNLSLGQRQMVALARAIVRRTKLVILDEATAAIDHETDARIHYAIGAIDQTVMIVAHRLRTISNVDKVMVLDAGRLVEFGPPRELLRVERGVFRGLVDGSGERDELYALIGGDE